ncbi:energy transducer TonB [Pacificimonas sp. WHA3]|uniref:Energy transducer TonB n=1 Tax=Pacificimonas pallii TaxID=2827236 RepID=A0ABS6SGT7_9SPHN|nr:energy transducer TonB [Pacificimonas pallii]MBV7257101.1 energy transducer TonB [Pacificimonas pallii]
MSNKRVISLVLVGLIHVFLGYAVISGLALKAVKIVTGPLETFEVEDEIVDEEEPPPPPEQLDEIPPYVPPPDVVVESLPPPPVPVTVVNTPPPPPRAVVVPRAPPAPPAPPPAPAGPTRDPIPRGNRSSFTQADYPASSERSEEEGTTVVSYRVGTNGRVVSGSCEVVQSSGHSRLDRQTCRILERRFRFEPALRNGEPIEARDTQKVRWELPDR